MNEKKIFIGISINSSVIGVRTAELYINDLLIMKTSVADAIRVGASLAEELRRCGVNAEHVTL